MAIFRQVSAASLLDVSAGNCQTALVDESGMIRPHTETHNRSQMVAMHGTPCAIPRNSNYYKTEQSSPDADSTLLS
jgi:hypothetical protein